MRPQALLLLAALPLAAPAPALAARLEIILDVSGSMRARIGTETRMDAARKAIRATLDGVQPGSVVALRLYGHRVPQEDQAGSCRDSELTVPFQPLDKAAFFSVVERAVPRGQTPLTYSLEQAAQDFGPASDEERIIILVSDGAESCGGDPAAAARKLLAQGFKVKVHTIGFDVDAAASAQLEAISTATGGEYHNARNAAALSETLTRLTQQSLLIAKGSDSLGEAIRGGDGYESAVALRPGQVYHLDHHQRENQFDYFVVDLKAGQKMKAAIETAQSGVAIKGDSFRETIHPYAGIVVQDSTRLKLGAQDITGARGERMEVSAWQPAGEAGRMYVLIGSTYGAQHKDSRFVVALSDLPGDAGQARDAGSRESEAIEIPPGSYTGYLQANDTVDFYKFRADPKATYQVRVRPTQGKKWLQISVADADGNDPQVVRGDHPGNPVRVEGLRFPKGGDVFVRIANHRFAPQSEPIESDYSIDLKQEGATGGGTVDVAQAPGAAPAASGSLLQRFVSFLLWSGVPLAVGLLVGVVVGYLLGRRK